MTDYFQGLPLLAPVRQRVAVGAVLEEVPHRRHDALGAYFFTRSWRIPSEVKKTAGRSAAVLPSDDVPLSAPAGAAMPGVAATTASYFLLKKSGRT